jgi:ubiquitin carboxyl-terminal hydrolase 36/42
MRLNHIYQIKYCYVYIFFSLLVTCSNCGRLSDTIENTNTWPVDVKFVQDIRKGMLDFLREEVLDGENAYKCDKCHKKTRATKKYSIRTAPNVLVVHLKRFDFSYAGKLSHFVSYPEQLNLKNFVATDLLSTSLSGGSADSKEKLLQDVSYKLYGVLVHLGHTSHSGHYYSYVKGPNEVWYKADDQRVSFKNRK